MKIFSEIYGVYYSTVARILSAAQPFRIKKADFNAIIAEHAYEDSGLGLSWKGMNERWHLLRKDGFTPIRNKPLMPLTKLQKSWLMAIKNDPRINLFEETIPEFEDVEPLFSDDDIIVFDRFADGDSYENECYRQNFRLILDAIRNKYPLEIIFRTRKGETASDEILPKRLEYSEKDDKFRLIGTDACSIKSINLEKIVTCAPCTDPNHRFADEISKLPDREVTFELTDHRNALNRVMMSFAHFKKEAEQLGKDTYRVTLYYDREDETEMLIRILSFGPVIKVAGPEHFLDLIKQRLREQKSCVQ